LEDRNSASAFFRDFLAKLISDSAKCGSGDEEPIHVILIAVASGLQFSSGTKIERLAPDTSCKCRFYYLRPHSGPGDIEDDVERMLKPVKPRRYTPANPREFRKELAALIADVETLSGAETNVSEKNANTFP